MIKLDYYGNNARGQSVFDVRADGEYLGQVVDMGRKGYRVFVGYYWRDFPTIRGFMEFFREQASRNARPNC